MKAPGNKMIMTKNQWSPIHLPPQIIPRRNPSAISGPAAKALNAFMASTAASTVPAPALSAMVSNRLPRAGFKQQLKADITVAVTNTKQVVGKPSHEIHNRENKQTGTSDPGILPVSWYSIPPDYPLCE